MAAARSLNVRSSGGKLELTQRLAAHLDGRVDPATTAVERTSRNRTQLTGKLTGATIIPDGQRLSAAIRTFFIETVGPSFRFDGPMRAFISDGAGKSLGDAVEHWHATRDRTPDEIAPQFELNRFQRDLHRAHPGGTRQELHAAWNLYRSLPVDERTTVPPDSL